MIFGYLHFAYSNYKKTLIRLHKVFFVYGLETGPCSRKVETGQLTDPVVSQVCNAETGEMFMMLHQRGEGGAPTLAVF